MLFPPSQVGYSAHRPRQGQPTGPIGMGCHARSDPAAAVPGSRPGAQPDARRRHDLCHRPLRDPGPRRPASPPASASRPAARSIRVLAAVGVSALLQHSETAFLIVKYAGAAYLLYLAWKAIRSGDSGGGDGPAAWARTGLWRVFGEGALTNLLNPKVALFILALPAAVRRSRPRAMRRCRSCCWALLFNVGGTSVNAIVACSPAPRRARLGNSAGFGRWLNRISALVFVGLGGAAGADGAALERRADWLNMPMSVAEIGQDHVDVLAVIATAASASGPRIGSRFRSRAVRSAGRTPAFGSPPR